jgi:hypothetical protein
VRTRSYVRQAVECWRAGNGGAGGDRVLQRGGGFRGKLVAAGWWFAAHAAVHKLKQSPDKTDWSDARMLAT